MKGIQTTVLMLGICLVSQVIAAEQSKTSHAPYQIKNHHNSGNTAFISGNNNKDINIKNVNKQALDRAVINQFAGAFGVNGLEHEMRTVKQSLREDNSTNIRYQQFYKGVPIIGAELIANVNQSKQLSSISGETSVALKLDVAATFTADDASRIALQRTAKLYQLESSTLTASPPVLSIYDAKLIGPGQFPAALVWRTEVRSSQDQAIRQLVLVDANNGIIHLSLNQVDTFLNRLTYTANNTPENRVQLPGSLVCDEATACANDLDAEIAKLYAGHTYNFYFDNHQRDSFDNLGSDIISTVHIGVNYSNAYWNGQQMGYGDGFSRGLDVVAHELTHAVTDHESGLFYHHQSGAINESLSDVWAELIDQTFNPNAKKWQIGDELVSLGLIPRPVRNMQNPEAPPYNDPAKMTSLKYFSDIRDNGGVHINSGINNKAVFLMTDGGNFNGITVVGLGIVKVAKIYYEVQTKLLTAGANYLDLYNALLQSCSNLSKLANSGVLVADCTQVKAAIDAVEMNLEPVTAATPQLAAMCSQGMSPQNLFFDNFETDLSNWSVPQNVIFNGKSVAPWLIKANTNNKLLWGVGYPGVNDFIASMNNDISVPATGASYLHFKHQYFFETYTRVNQQRQRTTQWQSGGVIEYSIDKGTNWVDAGSLIKTGLGYEIINKITGAPSRNPLGDRAGFIEYRYDINSSRLDLSSLAGKNVRFRWRIGTEGFTGSTGWFIDDVRIYQCATAKGGVNPIIAGLNDRTVNESSSVILDASQSTDPNNQQLKFVWTQTAGTTVLNLSNDNTSKISFMVPASQTSLVFKLTVTNSSGGSATKIVTLKVNKPPIADAGQKLIVTLGSNVSVTGSGTDTETLAENLIYLWTQISGPKVTLSNANSTTVNFVAPSESFSINMQLLVSDTDGGSSTDSVVISDTNSTALAKNKNNRGGGCVLLVSAPFDPILLVLIILFSISIIRKKIVSRSRSHN